LAIFELFEIQFNFLLTKGKGGRGENTIHLCGARAPDRGRPYAARENACQTSKFVGSMMFVVSEMSYYQVSQLEQQIALLKKKLEGSEIELRQSTQMVKEVSLKADQVRLVSFIGMLII